MNMLRKLAIWILRKTDTSVIISCKPEKPVRIRVRNTLRIYDNDFPAGTTFVFNNGEEHIFGRNSTRRLINKYEEMKRNDTKIQSVDKR